MLSIPVVQRLCDLYEQPTVTLALLWANDTYLKLTLSIHSQMTSGLLQSMSAQTEVAVAQNSVSKGDSDHN
jgi:hypothetical protein